jgi:hypothetical protein
MKFVPHSDRLGGRPCHDECRPHRDQARSMAGEYAVSLSVPCRNMCSQLLATQARRLALARPPAGLRSAASMGNGVCASAPPRPVMSALSNTGRRWRVAPYGWAKLQRHLISGQSAGHADQRGRVAVADKQGRTGTPRECWIPVPFPAPVRPGPNSLRHFQDRQKAQLPQAFARQAWGF